MTATATATSLRRIGAIVSVEGAKYPGKWRVVKVNPTTYLLESLDDPRRRLKASHEYVIDPIENETERLTAMLRRPTLALGAIVRVSPSLRGYTPDQLFVVLGDKLDTVNLAPLGGNPSDPRRYFRVPPMCLTVVDPDDIELSANALDRLIGA